MKAYPHSEEIYSKSRLCYFILTVISNRDRISYRLQDIFAHRTWKSSLAIYLLYSDFRPPSGGTPSNINVSIIHRWKVHLEGYNSVRDNMSQSSFVQPLLHPTLRNRAKFPEKFNIMAVQGHPRSSILVSIESAYIQLPINHWW